MTISDAFPVDVAAARPAAAPVRLEKKARPHVRMRAQDASVPRVTAAAKVMWSDLLESWWLPGSIPTVAKAWSDRFPERDRVPGGSDALWMAWAVYNHAVMLPVVALLNVAVGVLTPLVWALLNPVRLALLLLIAGSLAAAVAAA